MDFLRRLSRYFRAQNEAGISKLKVRIVIKLIRKIENREDTFVFVCGMVFLVCGFFSHAGFASLAIFLLGCVMSTIAFLSNGK